MPDVRQGWLPGSRLVRRLAELGVKGDKVPADRFAERIGQLVDLSGAVTLATILDEMPTLTVAPTADDIGTITDTFWEERAAVVGFVAKRFVARVGLTRNRLPEPQAFLANCMLTDLVRPAFSPGAPNPTAAFAPYRKFYVALQGSLSARCHRLRARIAGLIGGHAPRLAQIGALDNGLAEALFDRHRRLFDRVPILLERHFVALLNANWPNLPAAPTATDLLPWMQPGGWIAAFCQTMQDLLLAEIEIRLLPVVGLIDSIAENRIDRPALTLEKSQTRG